MKIKPTHEHRGVTLELSKEHDDALLQEGLKAAEKASSPFRLRTILAPVDFSENSAQALDYVRAFATQFDAQVVLAHIVEPTIIPDSFGIVPPSYQEISDQLATSAADRLEKLAGTALPGRESVKTVVRTGRASWEIVRLAAEVGADLIIITTHGYTGLKHVLMGSTAELIVRHAPCPVLTVRHPERGFVAGTPGVAK
jgi:nucleotide-binding universal stress UspA family protein